MVIKFPSKILVLFILLATLLIGFTYVIRKDAGKIVHKTLHDYDESTDSVVSANLSRSLFPAMLRLNSLVDKAYETDGWLFNAYWQHRPPLYTYIPVPFFIVQGRPSIETERLSFALVNFLTACVFIVAVFLFTGDAIPAVIATIAALIWIHGPFTRALVNGDWFGVSDIVLTFMTTCCLAVLLWYLSQELSKRTVQSWQRLFFYGIVMSLPILTKNLLGMIPAATFFLIFLCDHWWVSRRSGTIRPLILTPFISFFMLLFLYYGSLFLSSPETFKIEFPVALLHIWKNYEGWGRPWNWFIVNYLPLNYGIKKTLLLLLGGINLILLPSIL